MPYKDVEKRRESNARSSARYKQRNLEKVRQKERDRRALESWESRWKRRWLARYGILIKPDRPKPDVCELCKNPPGSTGNGITMDHDHVSGVFRGWLCSNCNSIIGLSYESPSVLRTLANYLRADDL